MGKLPLKIPLKIYFVVILFRGGIAVVHTRIFDVVFWLVCDIIDFDSIKNYAFDKDFGALD